MKSQAKLFFVRFGASSTLKLERPRQFNMPGRSVRVSDALHENRNYEVEHDGLLFSVELESIDVISAIQQSEATVTPIADLLATTHATAIGDPVFLFATDLDSAKTDREFAQGINNAPAFDEVRRTFSDDLFRPLFSLFEAVRAADKKVPKKHIVEHRLVRSLHYLRRSYLETDPIDRFEDLAAALQSLDPLIRRKHNLPTKFNEFCKKCHGALICKACSAASEKEDNWSGTDYVITKILKRSVSDARQLRKRRNEIAHALKQVPDLLSGLNELIEIAHEAALASLLEILGAADPTATLQPLPLLTPPAFTITATLHNLPVDQMRKRTKYPQLKLHAVEVLKSMSSASRSTLGVVFNLEAENLDEDWSPGQVYTRLPKYPEQAMPNPRMIVQKLRRPSLPPTTSPQPPHAQEIF